MRRGTHWRNPELIRPIDALHAAILRRDAPAALSWFGVIDDEDKQAGREYYADQKRAVLQYGEDDPNYADYYASARARGHQLKSLGRSEAWSSQGTSSAYSNDRWSAHRAISEGRGRFFKELRIALNIESNKRRTTQRTEPARPSGRDAQREHNGRMERLRKDDRKHYYQVRADSARRADNRTPERGPLTSRERLAILRTWKLTYPGISAKRVLVAGLLKPDLAFIPPGSREANMILSGAGVPAAVLAGRWWRAVDGSARSAADFLRANHATPTINSLLHQMNEDSSDSTLVSSVVAIGDHTPSRAQVVRVCNDVRRRRQAEKSDETLAKRGDVDRWLRHHAGGIPYYRKPAGWSWLRPGDGEWLCLWAARNGACIIDRIAQDNMGDIEGVLRGPKDQIVGIDLVGRYAYCDGQHSCCDRNNKHDARAWRWAQKKQLVARTSEEDRDARRGRIAGRKQERARKAIGSSRDYIRAESRGDWLAMASNPRRIAMWPKRRPSR